MSLCVYMCMYVCVCIYTYIYIYIYVYIRYVYACEQYMPRTSLHVSASAYTYVSVIVCICLYMYVCVYVYIQICNEFIHAQAGYIVYACIAMCMHANNTCQERACT